MILTRCRLIAGPVLAGHLFDIRHVLGSNAVPIGTSCRMAGKSHISMQDYAIALLDESETPKHVRQRFAVGY
jgi:hypothetical protein